MEGELHIKFYGSAGGKQNMWVEGCDYGGKRHEVVDEGEAQGILHEYIKDLFMDR